MISVFFMISHFHLVIALSFSLLRCVRFVSFSFSYSTIKTILIIIIVVIVIVVMIIM